MDELSLLERCDLAIAKLDKALAIYAEGHKPPPSNNSSASTVTVNAGGVGVWVCTILFSINLAFLISMSSSVTDRIDKQDLDRREDRAEIKRLNEYLLAIWAKAPYLKPEEEKDARPNYNP